MHLRGKVHNPENIDLAKELCILCDQNECLQFPDAATIKVPIRSNKTGELLKEGSLTHEAVDTILASKCQWFQLLLGVSDDLQRTGRRNHLFVGFGIGDCVPLTPFHQAGLHITKLDVLSFLKQRATSAQASGTSYEFPSDAVAVVGMACRLPGANTVEDLWNIMSVGESRAEEVPSERIDLHQGFRALQDKKWASKQKYFGNFINKFDCFDNAFFRTNPREAVSMDPQQRLLLETAYQAMDSSGYLRTHRRESGDPVGVFIGASFVEYLENTSSNPPTAYTSTGTIRAFLCGKISYYFGWSGPSEILDTACSSSLVAIRRAVRAIQTGECPMALTGGVNIMSGLTNYLDLTKAGFLSPTGQCKPFDSGADGYCRAEGVGLVVLKPLSRALAEGDQIIGVIPGAATNQGGLSSSITVPHSPAQVRLYKDILSQAKMESHQVSYVEAHGTGTQAGDPLEVASIREVFGGSKRTSDVHLGSIKGNIGHCETAAGVAGLIKALLMVSKGSIPPLANFKSLNPKILPLEPDKLAIATKLERWEVPFRVACVNSYGAAGSNSALLVSERPPMQSQSRSKGSTKDSAYPIVLSAATKESLLAYADVLEKYLEGAANKCDLGDLAFTLAEKRQLHKYRWITTEFDLENLSLALRTGIQDRAEVVEEPKKVVLAFSGQSQRAIGLDRNLYESCPSLQIYLNKCNSFLLHEGYPTIFPAIFQTEPVLDVVALQCGMFALQYACAKSWIDSGLHVDAIIGHSFGELSALAVSGVLSMEDTLKIIATRASLMQTKWGSQPGTMLAIHSTVEVVQDLISSLSFSSISIEIACYNAHTSQVVVGTDSAVASAEKVLREESRFSGISFQRLDVTHGFHSTFTEGLLGDLDDVANSLTFKAPEIPLETCTTKQLDSVTPGRISQHTRKPVYFHQAVQRIEQRLGSCIWLEAGMNSPIIPMIKKSADASRQHLFQSLKIKDQLTPLTSLCKSTTNLWREGVSVSFWNFHHPGESGLKQIWLPPYQFQSQQHWLPYTDHALEAMKNGPITGTPELDQPSAKPSKLVTSQTETGLFSIHVVTQRFTTIVSGHAVMGRPLCPAAMYMECAVMALQLSIGDPHDQVLWFEGLSFEAPLGIDTSRDVSLTLKHDVEESGWFFTARSASKDDPKSRLTTHAKGKLGFTKKPGFQRYQRLLTDRVDELLRNPNAEILKSKRAYGLFSRIVSYSEVLKGISLITMANCEAVAEIEVSTKAETGESSATRLCDTISLDTFIQVSGLLINSSDRCSGDEAYLATGVESQSMSLSCDFEKCRSWTIYAMFTPLGDTKATGDIFVMTRDRVLVMTIMGVQFSKIPISKLEKLLDSANTKAADKSLASKSLGSQPMRVSPSQDLDSAMSSEPPPLDSDSQDSSESEDSDDSLELESLKTILASYVGLPEDQITDDANIGELGVDSLAATELADELSSKFGKDIASDDLVMSDFGALSRLLVPQKTVKKSKATPQSTPERRQTPAQSKPIEESNSTSVTASQKTSLEADAIEALAQCNSLIEASVKKLGFTEYWVKVAPKQDELTLAYMADGLRTLGVDLWKLQEGDVVPQFNYLPRHTQLVQRLWAILDRLEITASEGSQRVRLSTPVTTVPPAVLLDHLLRSFPQYGNESRLLAATGPQLANCLIGKADGVALLFGSPQSQAILGDFYNNSPMLAALTDHLLSFVGRLMSGKGKDVVRILEVGAGFGGTTTRLAETLEGSGYRVEYTFTDISSMLVKNARQKFAKYPWMDFQTLNLEKDPAPALLGKYDFVIATNVVHATSSLVNSTRRIKSLLKEDGFLVLSEVTRIVDWYDLVYGLLEGWWLANDGRDYPLVPVETWIKDLKTAGFNDVAFSHGSSEESKSQQLIVASLKHPKVQSTIGSITSELKQRCRPETVVYKIVDETEIHADIYYPSQPTSTPMPVGKIHCLP